MAEKLYHMTDDGPKECKARTRPCPIGGEHFSDLKEGQRRHEDAHKTEAFATARRAAAKEKLPEFAMESFYGLQPPRSIQLAALNGVTEALEEDGVTQLVAACGTGKTYMGRQLMRHAMEAEDANGVAIVLTSSIKLAKDTASDMKPAPETGFYDQSMGLYGEDYVVIEIHSDSKDFTTANTVSTEKIAQAWREAQEAGKKVVLVSTYESSPKLQEVQALLAEEGVKTEADLLLNDEAHNIIGQQKSTSNSTSGVNTGYRSFHNEIPGAIQAKQRLYATATPVVPDSMSDADSIVSGLENEDARIIAMQAQAMRMENDQKARLTVYSDDTAVVGRVGGYISQHDAIEAGALSRPDYQLRAAVVKGNPVLAGSGFVLPNGQLTAKKPEAVAHAMTPQTYAAVTATLEAMVADPDDVNPVHNALAYCGSIDQAKAFRDGFKQVAIEASGGMELNKAASLYNSEDPAVRRKARLRLLGEFSQVAAAHSGEDAETKQARDEAFEMFSGRDLKKDKAEAWLPDKRVLANVDIFSEGVSISEIDTVVISDDAKTSERAMTQAVGRALRKVPGNDYKTTGHVIIPQAVAEDGRELNGGTVALTAYGATRMERGVATRKLTGQAITPDEETKLRIFTPDGNSNGEILASTLAKEHSQDSRDVVAAHALERAHKDLLRTEKDGYKTLPVSEQYTKMKSYIEEKAATVKNADAFWASAAHRIKGVNVNRLQSIRQSNRVLVSALGAGDLGSLSPELASAFVKAGVLKTAGTDSVTKTPTLEEKKELLRVNAEALTIAMSSFAARQQHPEIFKLVGPERASFVRDGVSGNKSRSFVTSITREIQDQVLSDDSHVEKLYEFISTPPPKKKSVRPLPFHDSNKPEASIVEAKLALEQAAVNRAAESAVSGSSSYEVNRDYVRSTGDLTVAGLTAIA